MEETLDDVKLELKKRLHGRKVVLLGIGNIEKGDDGFGVRLIQLINSNLVRLTRLARGNVALFECGTAPENYLGPIVKSNPQVVLILDAANLDAEPGHTHIIEKRDIATLGLSTHDTSLKLFISYLENNLKDVDIFLLGVQPKNTNLGTSMSNELKQLLLRFEEIFLEILS